MAAGPIRRFTLLDAMVLLAGTAVGLAGLLWKIQREREWITHGAGYWDAMSEPLRSRPALASVVVASDGLEYTWPFLAVWTLTLLALRSLPPRPSMRRAMTQPGAVACAAVTTIMALCFLSAFTRKSIYDVLTDNGQWLLVPSIWADRFKNALRSAYEANAEVAYAILAGWACLAFGRRWRPERS